VVAEATSESWPTRKQPAPGRWPASRSPPRGFGGCRSRWLAKAARRDTLYGDAVAGW